MISLCVLLQDPTVPIKEAQEAANWFGTASVASVLGLFLILMGWYFIRREKKQDEAHEKEKAQIRADNQVIITQKNEVIDKLAEQIDHISEQANTRLDRMVQMIADGGTGTQSVLADNAAAMAVQQQGLQELKSEIQQLRQDLNRGGR